MKKGENEEIEKEQEEESAEPEIYENVVGCENVKDVLSSLENRFIFLYHGVEKPEHMKEINLLGEYVGTMHNLDFKRYRIDMTKPGHKEAIAEYLKEKGSKLGVKQIMTNSFILCNKFNDIWFQELSLVQLFQKELQFIYKYFEGPRILPNMDFLLSSQSNLNDLHMVTYIQDLKNKDQLKKFKEFRQMSQSNSNDVFHFKYWIINDENLAKQLNLNTDPETCGDVYLLRKSSEFT